MLKTIFQAHLKRNQIEEEFIPKKKVQKENKPPSQLPRDFALNSELLAAADACQLSNNTVFQQNSREIVKTNSPVQGSNPGP